jgi:hypothetical protein
MPFLYANILKRTYTNYTNPLAPYPGGFEPRPEILRENHTLTIIAVGLNSNTYSNTVEDPLFKADEPVMHNYFGSGGERITMERYTAQLFSRALGCQEQVSIVERPSFQQALNYDSINFVTDSLQAKNSVRI